MKKLEKDLRQVAEELLEYNYDHNVWHLIEEEWEGHLFRFEGECRSHVKEGGSMMLEGAYCGDYQGELVIEDVEVQDLEMWDNEKDEWVAL